MKSSIALTVLFAHFVAAQSATSSALAPTGTSGIPPCVMSCVTQGAQAAGCTGITDLACICSNANFQYAAVQCLQANCSAADQEAALQLQQSLCGALASATSSAASSATSSSGTTSAPGATEADSEAGSATAAATFSAALNGAGVPAVFNFAAAGIWAAVALGGAVVAQLAI